MPDDPQKGVKSSEGTPPTGSGAGAGPPPDDDVVFEDDQIIEKDGEKLVPLDVAIAERKKRQLAEEALAAGHPLKSTPDEPDDTPLSAFDWEKLMNKPSAGGQQQGGHPQAPDPEMFNQQVRDMLEENPWQAMMWAFSSGMQQYEKLQHQARRFAPDYDHLPIHDVTEEEFQAVVNNPHALKALIAGAKAKRGGKPLIGNNITPPAGTPGLAEDERQKLINEGRKQERDFLAGVGRGSGLSGEGTRGAPSAASPPQIDLDDESKAYLKSRGYNDEQIANMTGKIMDARRRKGLVL